jgi:hypothetical protein
VLVKPFLGRLVVIGSYREDALGAQVLDFLRQFDDLGRVVPAGAGEHGNLALGLFESDLHHTQMFLARKSRTLSGSPARHQEVDSLVYLPPDEKPQDCLIEREVLLKRRNQRCTATCKHKFLFEQNFTKLVDALLAGHPLRRLQGSSGKPFTAPGCVPHRDGIRAGIEADLVSAGMRTGPI